MGLSESSRSEVEAHITAILKLYGHDTAREGLRDTPKRYAKFMEQFIVPEEFNFTTFQKENYSQMIVQKNIPFFSLCEHHLAPFFGTAIVAYIPNRNIVGLSKLARCVRFYAAGLQNQERVTMNIAKRLDKELKPKGVGVILQARHLCMEMRGVKTFGTSTVTSEMLGSFLTQPETRSELFSLTGGAL